MSASRETIKNTFLLALDPDVFELLAPHLEPVALPMRMILVQENKQIEYVYFPESGIASIVALTPEREMIEAGVFGYEGCSNFIINPGSDRVPMRTFMQVTGEGWRIAGEHYARVLHASQSFTDRVLSYEQYKAIQFAYTAISHGSYNLPERLARWILMYQDRVGDNFPITHDFLATMLAVRRAGVTEAIHHLEGHRAIKATRARIEVLDRGRLLDLANGSYGVPEQHYDRLILQITRPLRIELQSE